MHGSGSSGPLTLTQPSLHCTVAVASDASSVSAPRRAGSGVLGLGVSGEPAAAGSRLNGKGKSGQ